MSNSGVTRGLSQRGKP